MADDSPAMGNLTFGQAFLFTHIFRSFRIATHLSKLFLALFLLILIYLGGRTLDSLWPTRSLAQAGELSYIQPDTDYDQPQGVFITFFSHEVTQVQHAAQSVAGLQW